MNATQDASNDMQNGINKKLIAFNDKQNELIFSTRERLFKLEKTQNTDVKILCSMSIGICVVLILMCVKFGGFNG